MCVIQIIRRTLNIYGVKQRGVESSPEANFRSRVLGASSCRTVFVFECSDSDSHFLFFALFQDVTTKISKSKSKQKFNNKLHKSSKVKCAQ